MSRPFSQSPYNWSVRHKMRRQTRQQARLARRSLRRSMPRPPKRPGLPGRIRARRAVRHEVRAQRARVARLSMFARVRERREVRAQTRPDRMAKEPAFVGTRDRILGSLAGLIVVSGIGLIVFLGGRETRNGNAAGLSPSATTVPSTSARHPIDRVTTPPGLRDRVEQGSRHETKLAPTPLVTPAVVPTEGGGAASPTETPTHPGGKL